MAEAIRKAEEIGFITDNYDNIDQCYDDAIQHIVDNAENFDGIIEGERNGNNISAELPDDSYVEVQGEFATEIIEGEQFFIHTTVDKRGNYYKIIAK